FIVMGRSLPVGFGRQMTTRATGGPRGVARVALHLARVVGALARRDLESPRLRGGVGAHELGPRGLLVVVARVGRDAVFHEVHAPFQSRRDEGALVEFPEAPFKA